MAISSIFIFKTLNKMIDEKISTIISILLSITIYGLIIIAIKVFNYKEINNFRKNFKIKYKK